MAFFLHLFVVITINKGFFLLIMISYSTTILQFGAQGEKTGWSYISVSQKLADKLKPGNKKSFRVKGSLDDHKISGMALIPMGGGDFIMALKSELRKKVGKQKGDRLKVALEVDEKPRKLPEVFMTCLAEEEKAMAFFKTLAPSHQHYFGNWISSAKTDATITKRIAQAINALEKGYDFGQMARALKARSADFKLG